MFFAMVVPIPCLMCVASEAVFHFATHGGCELGSTHVHVFNIVFVEPADYSCDVSHPQAALPITHDVPPAAVLAQGPQCHGHQGRGDTWVISVLRF